MSEVNEPKPLTIDDLQMHAVQINAPKLRELIAGLRALPNVSEMAIINAIHELDRIATPLERNDEVRARLIESAAQIAEKRMPAVVPLIRTGAIPSDIMQELVDGIRERSGETEAVHPTCECPRCSAARERAARHGGSASAH